MSADGQYTLETPENVEVDFELAGIGSRFCAMVIDGLLMALMLLLVGLLALFTNLGVFRLFRGLSVEQSPTGNWLNWINGLLILLLFAVLFGYYTFFELLMRGQTPGKRAMKIRVIRDDGTPAAAMDIIVRNLVRVVDALPGAYAIGGAIMFFHLMHKRLGDIAAGTIVVKERELDYRAQPDKKYKLETRVAVASNSELEPGERRVLTGFLQRRVELLPEARLQLAQRLAQPLFEKYGGQYGDAESYIERLVDGRHHEDPGAARSGALRAWLSSGAGEHDEA
jgi:uncharacterized RDD family membrane protein YckC